MFDPDAESESPHGLLVELAAAAGIGQVFAEFIENQLGAEVIGIQKILNLPFVISAAVPTHMRKIHGGVADGEVVERAEQLVLKRVGQADLSGGGPVEWD
jgi:hypothetical protein